MIKAKRIQNYISNISFERHHTIIKRAQNGFTYCRFYHDGEFLGGFSDMTMYATLSAKDDSIGFTEDLILIDCNFASEAIDHLIAKLSQNFLAMAPVSTTAFKIVPHLAGLVVMTRKSYRNFGYQCQYQYSAWP